MRGIHRSAVDFPYKGPVMRKCFHVMCRGWIMLRHFHNFPYYSCGTLNCRIALKFDRHIGSTAAEVPVKFHSDRTGCILHFKCWCRRYTKSELDHQCSSRRNNAGPSAGTVLTTKLPMIVVQVFSLLMISKTFSMGGRHFGKSRSTRSDKFRQGRRKFCHDTDIFVLAHNALTKPEYTFIWCLLPNCYSNSIYEVLYHEHMPLHVCLTYTISWQVTVLLGHGTELSSENDFRPVLPLTTMPSLYCTSTVVWNIRYHAK